MAAKTTGAEDIVMLNNGCLCCTVRGDLVRMISELVSKKKGKFDHIVIETTGKENVYTQVAYVSPFRTGIYLCIYLLPYILLNY